MKIKALVNFCGVLSMHVGEVVDCDDLVVVDDLLRAGYIAKIEDSPKKGRVKKNEVK